MSGQPSSDPSESGSPESVLPGLDPVASEPLLRITEYTDPVCPWAWGSEPKLTWLRAVLGCASSGAASGGQRPAVVWRRVFGILFDEDGAAPPDAAAEAAEAAWYLQELVEISGHTGAPHPAVLQRVCATSWPGALAAKAAEYQGPAIADAVLRRLRETAFIAGEPADTPERVAAALRPLARAAPGAAVPGSVVPGSAVPGSVAPDSGSGADPGSGLDLGRLVRDAAAPPTLAAVRRDWAETRAPAAEAFALPAVGRHPGRPKPLGEDPADGYRYALPTLLLEGSGGRCVAAGWRTESQYLDAVRTAAPELAELCDTAQAALSAAGADPFAKALFRNTSGLAE